MRRSAAWRCARCGTVNLPIAEACRRCGSSRSLGRVAARSFDDAGLAAVLSLLLPGMGHLYAGRVAPAVVVFLAPVAIVTLITVALFVVDPLLAAALRLAVGLAAALTLVAAIYHGAVVLDAFCSPSTAGVGLRGKRRRDYLALAVVTVLLAVLYLSLYRQSTAWASLASRVFEPFERQIAAQGSAPAWSSRDRLNVVVLGVDTRDGSGGLTQNTDTIMVVSLDPLNRAGAMLSIPRDTLVPIPGRGEDKVNAAFAYGGAELARRTVSDLLEIPVHGYALIDFDGFRRVLDALGGVLVDPPLPVRDDAYPTDDFGVTRLRIAAGPQLMEGETALRYARSRHHSNDFSRAERQQRILAALVRRMSETSMLLRIPAFAHDLSGAVRSDLDPANLPPLARLLASLGQHDLETAVLRPPGDGDGGQLREVNGSTGYYLLPVRAALRQLVAELLYDPRVRAEAARVEIRSPGASASAATELAAALGRRRYQIVRVATVPEQRRTTVELRNREKRYSAEQLARLLGAPLVEGGVQADADVVIVLGDDFRGLGVASR